MNTPFSSGLDYLVSYGSLGDLGRFRVAPSLVCKRGDRVIVATAWGLLEGEVRCALTADQRGWWPDKAVGDVVRLATADDDKVSKHQRDRRHFLFDEASRLSVKHGLSWTLVDVDVSLDETQAVLYVLHGAGGEMPEFVSDLSQCSTLHVTVRDLASPQTEEHGCGQPNCGQGACSHCDSGGCVNCGAGKTEEVAAYFASLREQMTETQRMPLL